MSSLLPALTGLLLLAPPSGPLQRVEPRVHDVRYEVTLHGDLDVRDTPILMPLLLSGAFNRVEAGSVRGRLWLGGRPDNALPQRFRVRGGSSAEEGFPFGTHTAVLPVAEFRGERVRWDVACRVQSWSSRIDDRWAGRLTWPRPLPRELVEGEGRERPWPRDWPEEAREALRPQPFIESDDPIFAQAVREVMGDRLPLTPPYFAAKELVRYCVEKINVGRGATYHHDPRVPDARDPWQVAGSGVGGGKVIVGMQVMGASRTVRHFNSGGPMPGPDRPGEPPSPHDLVCVCVATLRAAGIPARPVIGVQESRWGRNAENSDAAEIVSWAEFYLPGAGWVPFDPMAMRGKALINRRVHDPWPEFGSLDDLNRRIPLAYHFVPPGARIAPDIPALWGWGAGGRTRMTWADQYIYISIISRGRATPGGPQR
ncbi:MAG: transglutaminase-like domain-containing protein [Planctomycetota bacterium]|nr:transglutaminase-like domain-containing protein [Planctomycetota bacterium]